MKNSDKTLFMKAFYLASDSPKLSYIEFRLKYYGICDDGFISARAE
ncbi:hypothetical protein LEP1GSC016_0353 [Leptospira borgpetersenii serovar Hardjo-bovis str. Sponselee]|uniref:Uncharacterized protein n=1 Tax=Leptospira borgpetersenii serovar Hardjo-bovis str. Sponselee TaxID=1303729 RepID=M6BX44_LEPBO|nr:hypothetical protein LEP1GSC016_0353 [Leptospira borgpetersenii serovar Hardjo-bovis str. Sponselee]